MCGQFIDKLAELEGARAPHGVGSHTWDIRDIAVKLHDHCEYVFVDTPGFEDSVRPPIQVLHTIIDWLGRNSAEHQGAIGQLWGPIVIGRPGGRDITVRDLLAGMYTFFQSQVTRAEVIANWTSIAYAALPTRSVLTCRVRSYPLKSG